MRRYPTGDISITKQSVWETLKHNQLGIHTNRGYTVNWGYSFWPLVSMVHCVSLHTLDINWGNTSTGDIIVSKQSVWEAQKKQSTGDTHQPGIHSQTGILIYISITKQSVWETLKHNQLGIHINRGYTVNWGYSFWQLVSMVHCVSLHTLDINWGYTWTGDISISKQSVGEYTVNLKVKNAETGTNWCHCRKYFYLVATRSGVVAFGHFYPPRWLQWEAELRHSLC